ncbi:hypothetical protein B0H13DRAFT_2376249 [Mycena leptocephala]|nr:hypothetical protein B0H13DRAFT_2376249 [Mycena leptocephala]
MASLPNVHLEYGPMLIDTLILPARARAGANAAGRRVFNMILYGVFVGQALTYYTAGTAHGCDTLCARVQTRIWPGRRDTETRTPQVFYLFVVETLKTGFGMAMGQRLDYFPRIFLTDTLTTSRCSWCVPSPPPPSHSLPSSSRRPSDLLRIAHPDAHAHDLHPVLIGCFALVAFAMEMKGGETGAGTGTGTGTGRWLSQPAAGLLCERVGGGGGGAGGARGHERGVGVGLVFEDMTRGGEDEGGRGRGRGDDERIGDRGEEGGGGGYHGGGDGDGEFYAASFRSLLVTPRGVLLFPRSNPSVSRPLLSLFLPPSLSYSSSPSSPSVSPLSSSPILYFSPSLRRVHRPLPSRSLFRPSSLLSPPFAFSLSRLTHRLLSLPAFVFCRPVFLSL